MILTISLNTTSTIQVKNGDSVIRNIHCFFPQIVDNILKIALEYGAENFTIVVLHGAPVFTSRLFPALKESFVNATFVIDGGKK